MKKINILIVDDEKAVGESLSIILQDEGYNCYFTDDGYVALQHMETHPVDILITDIRMPKMDGYTLIRRTHELKPSVAIIVMTAYNETELFDHLNEADLASVIIKPLDFEEVIKSIKRISQLQKF